MTQNIFDNNLIVIHKGKLALKFSKQGNIAYYNVHIRID